jgi:hypothetical protein
MNGSHISISDNISQDILLFVVIIHQVRHHFCDGYLCLTLDSSFLKRASFPQDGDLNLGLEVAELLCHDVLADLPQQKSSCVSNEETLCVTRKNRQSTENL